MESESGVTELFLDRPRADEVASASVEVKATLCPYIEISMSITTGKKSPKSKQSEQHRLYLYLFNLL